MASHFQDHLKRALWQVSGEAKIAIALATYWHEQQLAYEAGFPGNTKRNWTCEAAGGATYIVLWLDGERFRAYELHQNRGYAFGLAELEIPDGLRPRDELDGIIPCHTQMALFPRC